MSTTHTTISSPKELISIGVVSDTHFWPGGGSFYGSDGGLQLLDRSEKLLDTLVSDLNNADVDLIFHLGDVTCGGGTYAISQDEFHEAQKAIHDRLSNGQAPVFALPGNHDCPPGGGPWTDFERRWHLHPSLGHTIDTPFARLVLLNAQGHSHKQVEAARPDDPIYGWVSEAELSRLDEALATAGDLPVILFMHQLIQSWSGDNSTAEYYLVANAEAVRDILALHGNVRAVFQGHAHRFDVQQDSLTNNLCWFFICPAIIQYPLGWLTVTLSAQCMRVQFRSLPLPDLLQQTLESGNGQAWRAGKRAWHDMMIDIR